MKYYLDTEFIEGPQEKRLFGLPIGKTKPTIDFVSIGIVAEDGRQYYAISKDFNLDEAWNRYDLNYGNGYQRNKPPMKIYWLRENVLRPIYNELLENLKRQAGTNTPLLMGIGFSKKALRFLISTYGKTNRQIAEEIKDFVSRKEQLAFLGTGARNPERFQSFESRMKHIENHEGLPEFYAYFADYDWVAFCWLFGKMIDLPDGFPMYCRDLKQIFDEKQKFNHDRYKVGDLKRFAAYPKQTDEHHALGDAKWNSNLHKFLLEL